MKHLNQKLVSVRVKDLYSILFQRMGAGLWVIVILVLVIILACIGYCVWQRWGRKRTTQEQDQEKGDFNQVPQTDSQK